MFLLGTDLHAHPTHIDITTTQPFTTPLPTNALHTSASSAFEHHNSFPEPNAQSAALAALAAPLSFPAPLKMPNLSITSVQVTRIDTMMRTMTIQVILVILVSAMLSDRISARSRKTRHRSLRTRIRGLISMYSRTAA